MSAAPRRRLKRILALGASRRPAPGLTMLVYHRVAGGTTDERDLGLEAFQQQLDVLAQTDRVCSLDDAVDALEAGDDSPRVVVTFDDGFAEVYDPVFPLLAERSLPFTVYLATAYIDDQMHWDGSTAAAPGPGLSLAQAQALARSELCTIGNHTHRHIRPERLASAEVDECSSWLAKHLDVHPRHFAYPWGVRVPAIEPALRSRFRTASTGEVGRNHPGADLLRLSRVPVRGSDPLEFFRAKLTGGLLPERAYGTVVVAAKRLGVHA